MRPALGVIYILIAGKAAEYRLAQQPGQQMPLYIPRSQPDKVAVNARCLDGIDGPALKPKRFFDGKHWEDAQRNRIAVGGHASPPGTRGADTLRGILERCPEL